MLLCSVTLIARGSNGVAVSVDSGPTWNFKRMDRDNLAYTIVGARNGAIVTFTRDSVVSTLDAGATWQRETRWPAQTHWFYEWNDSVLIASVRPKNGSVRLQITRGAGALRTKHWWRVARRDRLVVCTA